MKTKPVSRIKRLYAVWMWLLMVMIWAAGCGSDSGDPVSGQTVSVVAISDVHFNPFYDTTLFVDLVASPVTEWEDIFESSGSTALSTWGEETNYPLLEQALAAAAGNASEASAVIFPGDILAHRFNEKFYELYGQADPDALHAFIHKTVVFFANQVRKHFALVPVMFTLGNNDSYAGDYRVVPGGAFLSDTAEAFYSTLLLEWADRDAYFNTYPAGGYFVAEAPGAAVRFVSLNSVLFSKHRTETCTDEPGNVPSEQLDWLEQVLKESEAAEKKVFIVTHVPAGMSIYSTVRNHMDERGKVSDADPLWKEACQSRFIDICRQHASTIEMIFSGHTHMDEYRLIFDSHGEATTGTVVTPAISPQFGNNPGLKVFTLRQRDWKPLDYHAINCDLDLVAPDFVPYYTFSDAYSTPEPITKKNLVTSLSALYPKLRTDTLDRQNYTAFYYTGHDDANIIDGRTWPAYWCGVGRTEKAEYIACVNDY